MNIKEYRNKNRKTIECPGGLEITIRKIKSIDYLRLGILPDTLRNIEENPQNANPEDISNLQRMFLSRGIVPTEEMKVVDKPIDQLGENELSCDEIDEEDTNFIIKNIVEFSFNKILGKEVGESTESFQEEQVPSDN